MDTIFISELRIETRIGVYEWEKRVPQTIELSLEVGLPGGHATASERIRDTIDYSKVVTRIERLFAERHFGLLEAAADEIAGMITSEFGAPWLKLSIAKLAPRPRVKKLGVTIERGRRE
jgi:dihydroneopterin aldolase